VERSRTDYYRILQVDPSANPLVVQAAYRVLAQIFHPDVSGDDAEMKRINAAWEVLGDANRRRQYDIERAGRHPGPAVPTAPATRTPSTSTSTAAPAPRSRTADAYAAFASHAASHGVASKGTNGAAGASPATSTSARHSDDHAGPPVGEAFGPMLKFGRYEGWTIGQVSRVDRPFLEWLRGSQAGRGLKDEIDAVLRSTGISGVDRRRYDSDRQRVHTWAPGAPTKLR